MYMAHATIKQKATIVNYSVSTLFSLSMMVVAMTLIKCKFYFAPFCGKYVFNERRSLNGKYKSKKNNPKILKTFVAGNLGLHCIAASYFS